MGITSYQLIEAVHALMLTSTSNVKKGAGHVRGDMTSRASECGSRDLPLF